MVQEREQASPPAQGERMPELDVNEITKLIPHRYPFLLVDRVTEHIKATSIKGYKNITINEPFFQGHFPGNPIMPGVLMLEAMAQLGAVLLQYIPEAKGKLTVFAGIDNARFRGLVKPGDRLDMECVISKLRIPIGKSTCKGFVNGKLVVEADMMFSIVDMPNPIS